MIKYLFAIILCLSLTRHIYAQEEQSSEPESFYSIEYAEGYEPAKPETIPIDDTATLQVYNEIIALRPAVEEAFARAHLRIAEDDLDEYQSALRRIEQAERHEGYEGRDALAVAYADLDHILGVIARLEALQPSSDTTHSENNESLSSLTPSEPLSLSDESIH